MKLNYHQCSVFMCCAWAGRLPGTELWLRCGSGDGGEVARGHTTAHYCHRRGGHPDLACWVQGTRSTIDVDGPGEERRLQK